MRHPWERRIDETEAEWLAFKFWLGGVGSRRTIPADGALAQRLRWTERATAFDAMATLPETAAGCAEETVEMMLRLVCLETRKHIEIAASCPTPVLELEKIAAVVDRIAKAAATMRGIPSEHHIHLDNLTPEVARLLQQTIRGLPG